MWRRVTLSFLFYQVKISNHNSQTLVKKGKKDESYTRYYGLYDRTSRHCVFWSTLFFSLMKSIEHSRVILSYHHHRGHATKQTCNWHCSVKYFAHVAQQRAINLSIQSVFTVRTWDVFKFTLKKIRQRSSKENKPDVRS